MNEILNSDYWVGYLSAALGWFFAFLVPVDQFLVFTTVLVMCDLYTGVRAAKKRKESIHSRGLRRTVEKIVVFYIAILLSEGMIQTFEIAFNLTYFVAFAIAITEFKSNIENIEVISGVNVVKFVKERLFSGKNLPPK